MTVCRYWAEWGCGLRADSSTSVAVAPVVTGRVPAAFGLLLPFEIEDCEAHRYWDWSGAGVHATGHRLTPLSKTRTKVEFTVPRLLYPYTFVLSRGLRRLQRIAEAE